MGCGASRGVACGAAGRHLRAQGLAPEGGVRLGE